MSKAISWFEFCRKFGPSAEFWNEHQHLRKNMSQSGKTKGPMRPSRQSSAPQWILALNLAALAPTMGSTTSALGALLLPHGLMENPWLMNKSTAGLENDRTLILTWAPGMWMEIRISSQIGNYAMNWRLVMERRGTINLSQVYGLDLQIGVWGTILSSDVLCDVKHNRIRLSEMYRHTKFWRQCKMPFFCK